MLGRTEDKIKTENSIVKKIKSVNILDIMGYYNYLSLKYEHKTKELYINYIVNFFNTINKDAKEITSEDINLYLLGKNFNYVNEEVVGEKSGTYRATIHSALKSYFTYLYNNEEIKLNPVEKIPRPKNKKNDQIERVYLDPDEIQILIDNIKNDKSRWKNRNLLILMTFLYTGIRCTALTEINIEDVDVYKKQLKVIDKRNKYRVFDIDDDYISLYNIVVKENKFMHSTSSALFLSTNKERINQKTVSRMLKKYSDTINKPVSPHKLRRSYGRNLYMATGDLYMVQNALGHSNIKTTQLYVATDKTDAAAHGMNAMKSVVNFK